MPVALLTQRWSGGVSQTPYHIFCYAIMVFGNTVFFRPVYLLLI